MQREQPVVELARLDQLVGRDRIVEFGAQRGRHVGGDRDTPRPARGRVRQPQLIIARQLTELVIEPHAVVRDARQIAAGILDGDDPIGMLAHQFDHRLILDVGDRAPRHVV